jgi:glycosyltransferase involved in cell wall biosynthesis
MLKMRAMLPAIVFEELLAARRSLRIAVVTETWPPEVNGVAKSAARFVEALRSRGHDIQLVRPRQGSGDRGGAEEVLMRGMTIPRYPDLRMGLPAKAALVRLWSFRRADVVHIVTEGPLGWSALQAADKLKLPVVSDFRTNFHTYSSHYDVGWLKRPILAYLRKFHNRTLATLVPTEAMRADLSALGFQRLRVIGRGVDTKLFNPARRDERLRAGWGAAPDGVVLLYVGRLAAEKNLPTLAAAAEAALAAQPRARLVFVGDGPARRELQARLPQAVFAGTRSGEDLAAHYASADIFLFPSLTETYGNVTLEAMASGLAVVAYDYAAAAAAIDNGVSGMLAPCGDSAAFAAHVAALASDSARARRLGESARCEALARGWHRVAAELEAVLAAAAHVGASQATANEAAAISAPSAAPASTSLG